MNSFKLLILSILVLLVGPARSDDGCKTASLDNVTCSYYRTCLEKKIPCGNAGYSLSYGEKYCKRFGSLTRTAGPFGAMSEEGLLWRDHTLVCLQVSLQPLVSQNPRPACDIVKSYSFESHPTCYTDHEHSVCGLPIGDWRVILKVVDTGDILSGESLIQIKKVISSCAGQIWDELAYINQVSPALSYQTSLSNLKPRNEFEIKRKSLYQKLIFIENLETENEVSF